MAQPDCPRCETNAYVGPVDNCNQHFWCHGCNAEFMSVVKKRGRAGFAKSTRARSERQEKHNARANGGRLTANSGAGSDKGDVKVPGVLREECKTTLAASYVLKLEDLRKVVAAARRDEIPIMRIAFGDNLREQFVVIESGWFQTLFNNYRENE